MRKHATPRSGFTLIELAIVLVIIGLIIGGVLVGQDLMRSAATRAQITQIEKYNQAVNTFKGKYGALPGDLNQTIATQFGFVARGACPGQGDGNGIIEGTSAPCSEVSGISNQLGETAAFWVDLSTAGLIDGGFTLGVPTGGYCNITTASTPSIKNFLPEAKIGGGNYIFIQSENTPAFGPSPYGFAVDANYFGVAVVSEIFFNCWGLQGASGITVAQAYNIDKKVDDSNPLTGRVVAITLLSPPNEGPAWAAPLSWDSNLANWNAPDPLSPSSATCFDNGGQNNTQMSYSLSQNNGAGVNCGLAIQFQ